MSKEVINIAVDVLKVHPRNSEFYDDISGEKYERFKESIKDQGIITPITVAPDMTIISGHQRTKAAKELGVKMIPVIIDDKYSEEDEKLKALIASNFSRGDNDKTKERKAIAEYVRLCGFENGRHGEKLVQNGRASQNDIAKELGISVSELKRILRIEEKLSEPMKELLDSGVITQTIAADVISSLSEQEQEELLSSLDVTKKYTGKEIQKYVNEIQEKEEKIKQQEAELQAQKELNEKYSALLPEIDELVKKKKIQYTDVLNMAKNNLSDEELVQFVKAVNNGKKYTEEQMEEEVRKWKVKTSQLTQEKDEIARSKVKVEEKIVEVDKPETKEYIRKLEENLREKSRENKILVESNIQQAKEISQAIGDSTNYSLVSDYSERIKKLDELIDGVYKYDYMANSFNEIPIFTRIEYKKRFEAIKNLADRVLNTIRTDENTVDMNFINDDKNIIDM